MSSGSRKKNRYMMDISLVHDDVATPRTTRHSNAHDTQTTPRDAASGTHARLPTPPRAALHPHCPRTHSLQQWPFWPSANLTLAHATAVHHNHAHTHAARPAHALPLGCHTERRSPLRASNLAHTRSLARKSRVALAATAMIAVPPLSCVSEPLSACIAYLFSCAGRLVLTPLFCVFTQARAPPSPHGLHAPGPGCTALPPP